MFRVLECISMMKYKKRTTSLRVMVVVIHDVISLVKVVTYVLVDMYVTGCVDTTVRSTVFSVSIVCCTVVGTY